MTMPPILRRIFSLSAGDGDFRSASDAAADRALALAEVHHLAEWSPRIWNSMCRAIRRTLEVDVADASAASPCAARS